MHTLAATSDNQNSDCDGGDGFGDGGGDIGSDGRGDGHLDFADFVMGARDTAGARDGPVLR